VPRDREGEINTFSQNEINDELNQALDEIPLTITASNATKT
jgi:hypothetical protein